MVCSNFGSRVANRVWAGTVHISGKGIVLKESLKKRPYQTRLDPWKIKNPFLPIPIAQRQPSDNRHQGLLGPGRHGPDLWRAESPS